MNAPTLTDGLKPYSEYKESGLPWVGSIPNHWELKRGKALFRKISRPVEPTDETVTCFRDGTVTLRKNRRTSGFTEALKEIGYQAVRKGDLVIHAMDAFAGAVGVSDSDGKSSPVYSVCLPRDTANPYYYAQIIRRMALTGWIQAQAKGIRERSTDFRFGDFGENTLPVPPPEEQAAIVRFLDHVNRKIDRFIRGKQKLIKLLNEQKQAIIHQAVTKGLDPTVPMKDSGIPWLGEIPGHWEVRRISRFSKVGNGSTPSRSNMSYWENGHYPWLNSSHVNRGYIDSADQFVTSAAIRECHLPKISPGSVLIAITGQGKTRGTASVLGIEATINQHIAYITPKTSAVSAKYLNIFLAASYQSLRDLSNDSGSTKGALTCYDIKQFKILVPPPQEQDALVNFVNIETEVLNSAITRTQREIALMQEYRTRLVADVVTGKVDVRGAVFRGSEELENDFPNFGNEEVEDE